VQYWLKRFEEDGLSGLSEHERSGRPSALNEKQLSVIDRALRQAPVAYGLSGNLWDGKTLSTFIEERYGVSLGVRQCQRLFRQLGFRLRKPRPTIALADAELQKLHKKNSKR
jgi:transposase